MGIHTEFHGSVAQVVVDVPPVNALTVAGWFALAEALESAGKQEGVGAVVLSARGREKWFWSPAAPRASDAVSQRHFAMRALRLSSVRDDRPLRPQNPRDCTLSPRMSAIETRQIG